MGDVCQEADQHLQNAKKEHARQQRQRDKAERRQEKPVEGNGDQMAELREHAAAQGALFNIGVEETETAESTPGDRIGV